MKVRKVYKSTKAKNMGLNLYIVNLIRILQRKFFKVILPVTLFVLAGLALTLMSGRPDQFETDFHNRPSISSTLLKENTECAIPFLDPFDRAMKRYFQQSSTRQDCSKFTSYFRAGVVALAAYDGGHDYDQSVILRSADFPEDKLTCCFEIVRFLKSHPYTIHEEKGKTCEIISENVTAIQPSVEYVLIKCFPIIPQAVLKSPRMNRVLHLRWNSDYNEILTFVRPPNVSPKEVQVSPGQKKMNVIVFVLDGVSRLNFIRLMRNSFSYLVNDLQAVDLQGYASVGGGTLENSFALLLGKTFDEVRSSCWERDNSTFDRCPWIWKKFAQKGYTTMFAEDYNSVFGYHLGGFKKSPTDYYLLPFSKWLGNRVLKNKFGHSDCVRNVPTVVKIVEYAKQASTALKSVTSFQLYWAGLASYLQTDPILVDQPLVELLRFWKQSGILNNTAVVIASDHGWKAGRIMAHAQARLENRLPFCFLLFPKKFQRLNPKAYKNLVRNKYRLTTHHDVHATLLQILEAENTFKLKSKPNLKKRPDGKSISLFLRIPNNRNCEMLEVTENWCICGIYKPLPIDSNEVEQLATAAVDRINQMMKPYPICYKYELWNILDAEEKQEWGPAAAGPEDLLDISKLARKTYRLVIQVIPKGASFQLILFKDARTGVISLSKDIFRINQFLHHCIPDKLLVHLCSCDKSWDNTSQRRLLFWEW